MKVIVVGSYEEASEKAAEIIEKIVKEKPDCTLGLATGSSPVGMYNELIRKHKEEGLDFSGVHTVNLDEYVGLAPNHSRSYRYFMDDVLFNHINIDKDNTYVAKGIGDMDENLKEFNDVLEKAQVDIQVLGVGADGHIGFNEPSKCLVAGAHKEKLDESTIDANQRFFNSRDEVPRSAITMGIGNIMKAKRLLLIVNGNKKEAAKRLLTDDLVDTMCPVTFLKMHRDVTVILEEALAAEIGYKY